MVNYFLCLLLCLIVLVPSVATTATNVDPRKEGVSVKTAAGSPSKGLKQEETVLKKQSDRDPERDSVETYKDLTKLLITLATGTLVLAPTLFGVLKTARIVAWCSLYTSFILLVFSVICGILALSTLAGSQHANEYNIDYFLTRLFAIPQWLSFVTGIMFFMYFVCKNLQNREVGVKRFGLILDWLVEKKLISVEEKSSLLRKIEES